MDPNIYEQGLQSAEEDEEFERGEAQRRIWRVETVRRWRQRIATERASLALEYLRSVVEEVVLQRDRI
ncbi:uncharacterized protein EAE97_002271 [Botrytis byssoidea]|uniref:Uncharacterized protein n=1 Tax=Botrytis byssoidea TaxID=139641 RepID=A0A9P5M297_9HELO|nr:uncharacterized protein EAE97_002271 [Botrytis byssoidea]KAF7950719.1 hypothetical protein EAE97_002271 [Botrytis byssoidea]